MFTPPITLLKYKIMPTPCAQEKRIENIENFVKDINDSITNRKDGFFKTIIELGDKVNTLVDNQERQRENVDKLVDSITVMSQAGAITKVKAEQVHEDMTTLKKTVDALRVAGIRTEAEDRLIGKLSKEKVMYKRWLYGVSIPAALAVIGLILKLVL